MKPTRPLARYSPPFLASLLFSSLLFACSKSRGSRDYTRIKYYIKYVLFSSLRVFKERKDCTRIILFSSLLFVCPKREEIIYKLTINIYIYIFIIIYIFVLFSSLRVSKERRDYTRINYYIKYILFSSLFFMCPKREEIIHELIINIKYIFVLFSSLRMSKERRDYI